MDPDNSDRTDDRRLSPKALDGLACSAIAAVVRQRALRRKLWEEKLKASEATKALCGRLARAEPPEGRTACAFAEDCAEQEALPPLCPLREETQQEDRAS